MTLQKRNVDDDSVDSSKFRLDTDKFFFLLYTIPLEESCASANNIAMNGCSIFQDIIHQSVTS